MPMATGIIRFCTGSIIANTGTAPCVLLGSCYPALPISGYCGFALRAGAKTFNGRGYSASSFTGRNTGFVGYCGDVAVPLNDAFGTNLITKASCVNDDVDCSSSSGNIFGISTGNMVAPITRNGTALAAAVGNSTCKSACSMAARVDIAPTDGSSISAPVIAGLRVGPGTASKPAISGIC